MNSISWYRPAFRRASIASSAPCGLSRFLPYLSRHSHSHTLDSFNESNTLVFTISISLKSVIVRSLCNNVIISINIAALRIIAFIAFISMPTTRSYISVRVYIYSIFIIYRSEIHARHRCCPACSLCRHVTMWAYWDSICFCYFFHKLVIFKRCAGSISVFIKCPFFRVFVFVDFENS